VDKKAVDPVKLVQMPVEKKICYLCEVEDGREQLFSDAHHYICVLCGVKLQQIAKRWPVVIDVYGEQVVIGLGRDLYTAPETPVRKVAASPRRKRRPK
jgi:hypothetical protein